MDTNKSLPPGSTFSSDTPELQLTAIDLLPSTTAPPPDPDNLLDQLLDKDDTNLPIVDPHTPQASSAFDSLHPTQSLPSNQHISFFPSNPHSTSPLPAPEHPNSSSPSPVSHPDSPALPSSPCLSANSAAPIPLTHTKPLPNTVVHHQPSSPLSQTFSAQCSPPLPTQNPPPPSYPSSPAPTATPFMLINSEPARHPPRSSSSAPPRSTPPSPPISAHSSHGHSVDEPLSPSQPLSGHQLPSQVVHTQNSNPGQAPTSLDSQPSSPTRQSQDFASAQASLLHGGAISASTVTQSRPIAPHASPLSAKTLQASSSALLQRLSPHQPNSSSPLPSYAFAQQNLPPSANGQPMNFEPIPNPVSAQLAAHISPQAPAAMMYMQPKTSTAALLQAPQNATVQPNLTASVALPTEKALAPAPMATSFENIVQLPISINQGQISTMPEQMTGVLHNTPAGMFSMSPVDGLMHSQIPQSISVVPTSGPSTALGETSAGNEVRTDAPSTASEYSPKVGGRIKKSKICKVAKNRYSKGALPSNYCHICGRNSRIEFGHCQNVKRGLCRKVICEKCLILYEPKSLTIALANDGDWRCTHCRDECPDRARCKQYTRNNQKRREKKAREKELRARLTHQQSLPVAPTLAAQVHGQVVRSAGTAMTAMTPTGPLRIPANRIVTSTGQFVGSGARVMVSNSVIGAQQRIIHREQASNPYVRQMQMHQMRAEGGVANSAVRSAARNAERGNLEKFDLVLMDVDKGTEGVGDFATPKGVTDAVFCAGEETGKDLAGTFLDL